MESIKPSNVCVTIMRPHNWHLPFIISPSIWLFLLHAVVHSSWEGVCTLSWIGFSPPQWQCRNHILCYSPIGYCTAIAKIYRSWHNLLPLFPSVRHIHNVREYLVQVTRTTSCLIASFLLMICSSEHFITKRVNVRPSGWTSFDVLYLFLLKRDEEKKLGNSE